MKTLVFLILVGMIVGGHILGKPKRPKKEEPYVAPRFIQEILVEKGWMLAEDMTKGDDDVLNFESVEEEEKRKEEENKKKMQEYYRRRYDPAWDEGREEIA